MKEILKDKSLELIKEFEGTNKSYRITLSYDRRGRFYDEYRRINRGRYIVTGAVVYTEGIIDSFSLHETIASTMYYTMRFSKKEFTSCCDELRKNCNIYFDMLAEVDLHPELSTVKTA